MKSVEEMLKELEVATKEMLFVPNDLLPEAFHDDVRGGRTLASRWKKNLSSPLTKAVPILLTCPKAWTTATTKRMKSSFTKI